MKAVALAVLFTIFVVVAEGKKCRSSADCGDEECCIAQGILGLRKGDCEPKAKINETCSADDDMAFNNKYYLHCPCASGLTCEPEQEKSLGIFGKIKINERCVGQPQPEVTSEPEVTPEPEEPEVTPEPEEPEVTPEPEQPEETPEPEEEADE